MKSLLTPKSITGILAVSSCAAIFTGAFARVELPSVFSDNMVLQRETEAPVWGKAAPDATVTVTTSWNGESYSAEADDDGKWALKVETGSAGGPFTVTVSDGEALTLNNVMLGEVWVCSGQSNMEMALRSVKNGKEEIADADYPDIRIIQIAKKVSEEPLDDVATDTHGWQMCSPQSIPGFSAVAYFFARELNEKQGIPVGLIGTYWGGTICEAWTSGDSLKQHPDFKEAVEKMEQNPGNEAEARPKYEKDYAAWEKQVENGDVGTKEKWMESAFSDSDWSSMNLPLFWEEEIGNVDGIVWFRKTIDIPSEWEGKDLTLYAGAIDDEDVTFFNGKEIGRTQFWNAERKYTINGSMVKAGKAVIAIRVFDTGGNGGIWRGQLALELEEGKRIDLAGAWKYKTGFDLKDAPKPQFTFGNPNRPTVLYNGMIAPIVPFSIRGAIWYQGESNSPRAYQYRELFPLMINDWREQWGYDFPFYFVQLSDFIEFGDKTGQTWAELREAQTKTLALKNTGMAVSIDIGDPRDVHPRNKQEVGRRLSLIARSELFKERIISSGPMYRRYVIDGDKVRLSFSNERGRSGRLVLKTNDGEAVRGFEIAGLDHKFYKAEAVIDGSEIVVSSPEVTFPVAVRYDWANSPDGNVCNGSDLPLSTFRTDDWPGVTFGKK